MNHAQKKFISDTTDLMKKEYLSYKGRQIVVFGAGGCGKKLISYFKEIGLYEDVVAFADNNEEKWGV
jgi:D-arabinose 1-dehydrogenase-like Zn-dependent alcohol dehydrogenase